MLKVIFIIPFPISKWVPNLVLVDGKQGMTVVYIDFHPLNNVFPQYNYFMPFTD